MERWKAESTLNIEGYKIKSISNITDTALVILFKASEHHKNITHTNTSQLQWHQVVCSGTKFSNGQHSLKIAPSEVYTACLKNGERMCAMKSTGSPIL